MRGKIKREKAIMLKLNSNTPSRFVVRFFVCDFLVAIKSLRVHKKLKIETEASIMFAKNSIELEPLAQLEGALLFIPSSSSRDLFEIRYLSRVKGGDKEVEIPINDDEKKQHRCFSPLTQHQ